MNTVIIVNINNYMLVMTRSSSFSLVRILIKEIRLTTVNETTQSKIIHDIEKLMTLERETLTRDAAILAYIKLVDVNTSTLSQQDRERLNRIRESMKDDGLVI